MGRRRGAGSDWTMQFRRAVRYQVCLVFIFLLVVYSSHPPHAHAHAHGVNEQINIADNDQRRAERQKLY